MRYRTFAPLLVCLVICLALPFSVMATQQIEVYPPEVAVEAPETVSDGIAFLCSVKAPAMRSVTVTFLNRSVTAKADAQGQALFLLPVPLDHEDEDAPLAWKATFAIKEGARTLPANGTVTVKIRKKAYPVQSLNVAPKYVSPPEEYKERIAEERKLMGKALTTRTPVRHWNIPMLRPVPGKTTSWYGLRRVFNGKPRAPHKGLDFRAAAGDPIAAIADGTVALTGDFYYPGKFVVVDHGLGVVSISMHMSEIIAKDGQKVKAGDVIGLVGSTGRSTGPHLHLGLSVLGQSIDAFPLLDLTDADKAAYAKALESSKDVPVTKNATKRKGKTSARTGKKTSAGKKAPARKTQ